MEKFYGPFNTQKNELKLRNFNDYKSQMLYSEYKYYFIKNLNIYEENTRIINGISRAAEITFN